MIGTHTQAQDAGRTDEATATSDVVFLQRGESGWAVTWLHRRRKTTYQV